MESILEFQGVYRFLSNFYPSPFMYKRVGYKTVEHFFQAHKALYTEDFLKIVMAETPAETKKLGRGVTMRQDWDCVKYGVMRIALEQKFKIPELRQMLIDTGDAFLQEGNSWSDKVWGVCLKTGVGENNLGKLLMEIRSEITGVEPIL